ncbi:Hydroxyacylglutathione hydrolase [Sedimentisphaera cyanobacteriorum]|uniref:Hydroxyacylglutathione hydrolase n=1 Tax=Sedimentisphaera cyanobacteriorum TaxID=1940790 RepID=A0A1Q2HMX4_9BACT|nr:hydroxyacylglutathione hydrolase [Sedimentisphaera cyanobacteriorum]AQQ08710.1 Hydroxyacylglutathione hydrolase [Sedimentisphaera cyanobacteriorum]
MERVITLTSGDNYIYLYVYNDDEAFVVDPGSYAPVSEAVESCGLSLRYIFLTHHHLDHTGGIGKLRKKTKSWIFPDELDSPPQLPETRVDVIPTPGHTKDSICILLRRQDGSPDILFTGDTLFIGGCGRPIECRAKTLWQSLEKIASLPEDTLICPGHNYTAENCRFGLSVQPDNELLKQRLQKARKADIDGIGLVPSTVSEEKQTNIFMRAGEEDVKAALGMQGAASVEVFEALRKRKNRFG